MAVLAKLKSGDEVDCFSRRWRRKTCWHAGKAKAIKRRFNKRFRKTSGLETQKVRPSPKAGAERSGRRAG